MNILIAAASVHALVQLHVEWTQAQRLEIGGAGRGFVERAPIGELRCFEVPPAFAAFLRNRRFAFDAAERSQRVLR